MPHSYENYEIKSKTYTSLRKAVGIDYHLNHFSKSNVPLSEQILLDGGCGTGNYAVNFARKFKEIHCFDYSKGMLEKAKENMVKTHGSMPSNIYFRSGNICMLEGFHDNMFDSICVNQVLHHLRPDNDFEDLKTAISELYRVLKPGGRLVINFSPFENVKRAMYWAELVPKASKEWSCRSASLEKMKTINLDVGFDEVFTEPLLDDILYEEKIYHPINFIENLEEVLASDSLFALAEKDEIQQAVFKVQNMKDNNTLDEWFANKELKRKSSGQTMNLYAVKK